MVFIRVLAFFYEKKYPEPKKKSADERASERDERNQLAQCLDQLLMPGVKMSQTIRQVRQFAQSLFDGFLNRDIAPRIIHRFGIFVVFLFCFLSLKFDFYRFIVLKMRSFFSYHFFAEATSV